MKKLIVILLAGLALPAFAAFAEPSVLRQGGDCKIVRAKFHESGTVKVTLKNADLAVVCSFRADDFFGRDVVMANPEITNLAGKELAVAYHVAFFNKAGDLLGSVTQQGTLKPTAKDHQFASCIATVPASEVANISSYKVCVYVETPRPKK